MRSHERVILFIDDSELYHFIIQQELKEPLASVNAAVIHYSDPQEALVSIKALAAKGADMLAFVDLNMPVMNGFELIDETIASVKNIPTFCILSSSLVPDDHQAVAKSPHIKDIIVKPIFKEDFMLFMQTYKKHFLSEELQKAV